jgi:hypothetical protein
LNYSLDIRWMRSAGTGAIYVRNKDEIARIDSAGRIDRMPLPAPALEEDAPLSSAFFSTPEGDLWYWDRKTRLLRYAHPRGWEEAIVPPPGTGEYQCRLASENGAPRLLCFVADSAGQGIDALSATIAWPAVSPWEKADLPPAGSGKFPDSLWAVGPGNGDSIGLFLSSRNARHWRKNVFTVNAFSGAPLPGDTLPFPPDWTGGPRTREAGFAKDRVALVSQPDRTWISLGEALVLRQGSTWTYFYSNEQSAKAATPSKRQKRSALSYQLTRAVPYLYTGFLAVSAAQSGDGWQGETAWALGGYAPGLVVGGLATMMWAGGCASPSASGGCGSGKLMAVPLVAVPLAWGIWNVAGHQSKERRDRTQLRTAAAALGALAGASLGAVAGYRLAWFE